MINKIVFSVALLAAAGGAVYFLKFHESPMIEEPSEVVAVEAQTEAVPEPTPSQQVSKEDSLVDQQAEVFHVVGGARILKKGNATWAPVSVGTVIGAGDQVKTDEDALVEIHYDAFFLNTAKITGNSLAEFVSIEPTKIFVSSGAIYSSLEGLPEGSTYDVITPTAVGGVRSTVFVRSYDPSTQSDQTVVLEGTVYLAAGAQDIASIPESELRLIHKDEQFAFTGEELSAGTVAALEQKPLSLEEQAEAHRLFAETKERVVLFAGGSQAVQEAREAWREIKQDPRKIASLKAKMEITRFHQRIEEKKEALTQKPVPSPAAAAASLKPVPAHAEEMPMGESSQVKAEMVTLTEPPANLTEEGLDETMAVKGDVYDTDGNSIKKK